MDNRLFPSPGAHLAPLQPCGPDAVPAVAATGTKGRWRRFLWITGRLCRNYPQFYAPGAKGAGFKVKSASSAYQSSAGSYIFDSYGGKAGRTPANLFPEARLGLPVIHCLFY